MLCVLIENHADPVENCESADICEDTFCLAFQSLIWLSGILLIAVGVILITQKISQWILFFRIWNLIWQMPCLKSQMSVDAKRFGLALW